MPGAGGVESPGTAGSESGGEAGVLPQGGAAGSAGGSVAGAANGGEPASSNGGAGGEPNTPNAPVSVCGPGMWSAGEGFCQPCPATRQAFELACADYPSGVVFANLNNVLRFALVNLPAGVEVHEVSPEGVTVTYLGPDESVDQSFASEVRFGTSNWTVDLSDFPDPPASLIISPFDIIDVCGDTFQSLEPVRLDRDGTSGTTYEKECQ
jgi:hypothetical protein